ncbi:MAG TPA: MBL fold metallo-hydrolase [Symbiobacteriaceae bacterium]|jgi:glyoxylase-like metal-dependent hydrolase (beta-lactamase superfamily II)|nr:MBL fold metallo-hydrolase [Symbiobacteriaceae bacterium]
MSLIQLTERVYIYRGGVNFAIVKGDCRQLLLIDSGLDSGNARKALRPFLEEGWSLGAIINTHSHSDHIGGNADLVKRTGCQVWAPARERPFILWPELEPLGLYGGAWPLPALQVKFLQAQPTPAVSELPPAPCTFTLYGVKLEVIPVPGHSLEQVAISVDGVLIAADGLFQRDVIEKHPIIFLVNVADYGQSLDRLLSRPERFILPGHGDLVDRETGGGDPLPDLVEANRAALQRLEGAILDAVATERLSGEELLYRVVGALGKQLESEPQYFLDRAAISAHISYLVAGGRILVQYEGGRRFVTLAR